MLIAEHLEKNYRKRRVVKDASYQVDAAQVVGLLGPNGAGKTTSFYMTIGLVRRAQLGLSYLPQEASVFRKLSVRDNILAILELATDLNKTEREARAHELMQDLGIADRADTLGQSLSGGERRRCEIARTLACNPRYILLDEPFAGVDPIAVGDIRNIITHLTDRGIGVLITDHNVRETLKSCDRAYILSDGAIIAEGSPAEIVAHEEARRVYLGEDFTLN